MTQGPTSRRTRHVPASASEPLERLEPRTLLCAPEALLHSGMTGAFHGSPEATVSAFAPAAGAVAGEPPGPGPGLPTRPGTAWTTGLKRLLYVRVAFADDPAHRPQTFDSARKSMVFADAFFRANSFGKTSLRSTITDVIVLPQPEAFYDTAGWERLRNDALTKAKALRAAWDSSRFELDVIRYDGGPAPKDGEIPAFAITGGRGTWLRTDDPGIAVHELGHNLGLHHSNLWQGTDVDAPSGAGTHYEYGNPFSVMGVGTSAGLAAHLTAWEKNFLGWLPDDATTTVERSGRYTVQPADSGRLPSAGQFAALKVRKDLHRDYWLAPRAHTNWANNPSLGGLEVGWNAWSKDSVANSALGSHLLDMTPEASAAFADYGLPLGHTFSDESAGFHITPLRRDAAGAVEVAVQFDADQGAPDLAAPAAPRIAVVGATPGGQGDDAAFPLPVFTVTAGQVISLSATSGDADGDELAYSWDFGPGAAGGALGPGGLATRPGGPTGTALSGAVTTRYDTPGVYRVRVTFSDLRGGTSSGSVLVRVTGAGAGAANVITGRVMDALGSPLGGARVGDGSVWTYTDSDGTYALAGLDAAPRFLLASKPGGWSFERAGPDGTVRPAPLARGPDFYGTPNGYQLTGTVTTLGGFGVKDVLVSDGKHSTLTDGLGRWALPAFNGVYDVTFSKAGFPIPDARAVVVDGGDAFVGSVANVTGVAGSVRGIPSGVTVHATYGIGQPLEEVIGGAFRFNDVPRGTWLFTATGRGRDGRVYNFVPDGWSNPLTVDGNEGTVRFKLAPADTFVVSGRVTAGADPVAGATITVVDKANDDAVVATTRTDDAGRYVVDGLPAGAYGVSARKPGVDLAPGGRRFVLTSNRPAVDFRTAVAPQDLPPTFTRAATAEPSRVTGVATWLSATAVDDRDTDRLVYSWSVLSAPDGGTVSFSRDDTNAAERTLATFDRIGVYAIESTVYDTRGGRASSTVWVTVVPVLSGIRIDAPYADVAVGTSRQFRAVALDQFGLPMDEESMIGWQLVGSVGSVSADGLFTASGVGRGGLVARAGSGSAMVIGTATIDVRAAASPVNRRATYSRSAYDGVWARLVGAESSV